MVKKSACHCRRHKRRGFDPWIRKIPWRRKRQPTPVFLPGESHGHNSLAGYGPWVTKSQTQLEQLSMHTSSVFISKVRLKLVPTSNGNGELKLST